jgi:hypothetical protein
MNKSLINTIKKRKSKTVQLPAKIRAFANLKRLDRMKPPELLTAAKLLGIEYQRTTDPAVSEAIGKLIIYIRDLLQSEAESEAKNGPNP